MPKLAEVDTTFAEEAHVKIVTSKTMAAGVADVWAVVTHNPTWTEWFPMMTSCETTSDPAFGVGPVVAVGIGRARESADAHEHDRDERAGGAHC